MVFPVRLARALRLGPPLCSRRHRLQESLRSRDVCARAKEASADEQPDATEKAGEQVKEVETEVAVRAEAGFSGALDDFDDGESDIEYDDHLPFDYDPNAEGDDDELYRDAPAWDEGWEADEAEDEEGEQMQTKQAGEWDDKVVQVNRVTKVLKGGKLMKFRAVVVSGDRLGSVGCGVASAREVAEAVERAAAKAQLNAVVVPIVGARTFPHKIQVKERASRIMLRPAAEGTGVIAGGSVRTVLELAGYQNCFGKIYGTKSNMNNARATIKALREMWTWEEIAEKRGCTIDYAMGRVPEPDLIYVGEEEDFEEVEVEEGEDIDELVEEVIDEAEDEYAAEASAGAQDEEDAEYEEDNENEEEYEEEVEDDDDDEGKIPDKYLRR